jgi:outer membrane protein assembly factor BamD (BamD/ComL family)
MIDRARSLASAGQGDRAVDVLDEYGRRFPHGVLAEEAALVRLEITVRRGDGAGASALAQRFLTDYPHSVHGDRVRAWADAHFE